jgi:crotonobetainyl-CoA:carnitine CoA-transferase CaiB-like acyl-CoA transferase
MTPPAPLAGLRVLDLSRVLAGPFAGRMLADLGADVVKVEPPEGDITRGWGQVRHGLGGYYVQQNVGKRTLCVDLAALGGAELVLRLAARADVLIENFRPHVMARHGLGWQRLSAQNPRLVMLSISGFGAASPEAHRPAYAPVLHAESGAVARQAQLDRAPHTTDFVLSNADTNAGLHGLVAILAALHLRERSGVGQHIDLAMLDAMLATDDYAHFALDEAQISRGGGEVWDAPGGPIMVTGDFRNLWRVLTKKLGVIDPTPENASLDEKIRARRAAAGRFYASAFATRAELTAALDRAAIPWGDVRSVADAFASPTARARGSAALIDDRAGGERRVVQSPYRFSAAPSGIAGGVRYRGEDNRAVLADWLGAADDEISRLEAAGVLLAEKRP